MSTKVTDLTALSGSGVDPSDTLYIVDATVSKKITAVELFNSFPVAVTTELLGTNAVSTDELLISDAGVAKTITLAQFISAIAKLGFTLADIPAYADQAAAATALTGTGQLFRFNTTGALGITIT
jgi:hypothetical protein